MIHLLDCGVHSFVHHIHSFIKCVLHAFYFNYNTPLDTMRVCKQQLGVRIPRRAKRPSHLFFSIQSLHIIALFLIFPLGVFCRAIPQNIPSPSNTLIITSTSSAHEILPTSSVLSAIATGSTSTTDSIRTTTTSSTVANIPSGTVANSTPLPTVDSFLAIAISTNEYEPRETLSTVYIETAQSVTGSLPSEPTETARANRDTDGLSSAGKVGIGIGVPISIFIIVFLIYHYAKVWASKRGKADNTGDKAPQSDKDWQGGYTGKHENLDSRSDLEHQASTELEGGVAHQTKHQESSGFHPSGAVPSVSVFEAKSWGPMDRDWGPISDGRRPSLPQARFADQDPQAVEYAASVRSRIEQFGAFGAYDTEGREIREKRRPPELNNLSPYPLISQQSPGLFPPPSPANIGGSMSSRTSSILGLTNFYSQFYGNGHARNESVSTKRSNKSRKGSVATMKTSNYDMEMATLSSTLEPQHPSTPKDYEGNDRMRGLNYPVSPGFPYFDHDFYAINPIKLVPPPQPILTVPKSAKHHRHSRTSSSGINVMNFMGGIPSPFSSPKRGPVGNAASEAKTRPIKKVDIRVIPNRSSTHDRNDENDDVESMRSIMSPKRRSTVRRSRRNTGSSIFKRSSKRQSEDIDGESVWTDSEEERDSMELQANGGLGSRFGNARVDITPT
ncbi:hypothetical protein DFH27DRAFT_177654 [Peziza echinospora]|nr:hypothetical protein DFH27DRAFT_177654 [Peziza echinospora]